LHFAANDAVGTVEDSLREGRREDHAVTKVTQYGVEIVRVPRVEPLGGELLCECCVD
jgi:hypothetical protein